MFHVRELSANMDHSTGMEPTFFVKEDIKTVFRRVCFQLFVCDKLDHCRSVAAG